MDEQEQRRRRRDPEAADTGHSVLGQSATKYVRVTRYGTEQQSLYKAGKEVEGVGGAVKSGSRAIYNALSILPVMRYGEEDGGEDPGHLMDSMEDIHTNSSK